MSEQPQQATMPVFSIEKIYLKDLSLEAPGAPQVFSERESPKIDVNIHNAARTLSPGLYYVIVDGESRLAGTGGYRLTLAQRSLP